MSSTYNEELIIKGIIPQLEKLKIFTNETIEELSNDELKQWLKEHVFKVNVPNVFVIRCDEETFVLMSKRRFLSFMLLEKKKDVKKYLSELISIKWLDKLEDYENLFERFDLLPIVYFIPVRMLSSKSLERSVPEHEIAPAEIRIPEIRKQLKKLLNLWSSTFYDSRPCITTVRNTNSKFNNMKGYFLTDVKHTRRRFNEIVNEGIDELFYMEQHSLHHLIHERPYNTDVQTLIKGYKGFDVVSLFNLNDDDD